MEKLYWVLMGILAVFVISFTIFVIYTAIRYANTPISELPTWAWWLLH